MHASKLKTLNDNNISFEGVLAKYPKKQCMWISGPAGVLPAFGPCRPPENCMKPIKTKM